MGSPETGKDIDEISGATIQTLNRSTARRQNFGSAGDSRILVATWLNIDGLSVDLAVIYDLRPLR